MGAAKKRRVPPFIPVAVISLILAAGLTAVLFITSRSDEPSLLRLNQQIREILQLHTAEHIYRDIVYIGEQDSFLGFSTRDQHLLFSIRLSVQAGIDVQAEEFNVYRQPRDSRLYITLPPARIFNVDADEHSIHEYFSGGRGNAITMLSYFDEIAAVKSAAAEDARQRGILQQAEINAKTVIGNLLRSAGIHEIVFEDTRSTS
ncbi:MAG: DUF4230 domain-containing protein [Spirochaeta sp.]